MPSPIPPRTAVLYRLGLEDADHRMLMVGTNFNDLPPYDDVRVLDGFIQGYKEALTLSGAPRDDGFWEWLRDEANAWPGEGWARAYLKQADGDHRKASEILFGHVQRYALEIRPAWFVAFNQTPQPSFLQNGLGEPSRADIRSPEHVRAVTGASPVDPPNLRITSFQMGDGLTLMIGLPADVARWWNGTGYRVAFLPATESMPDRLSAATASQGALRTLKTGHAGCVLDARADSAEALAWGGPAALLVRGGRIAASAATLRAPARWKIRPGDRVLILTPALWANVKKRKLLEKKLPTRLATGDPTAWAQMVDTPARRLAVGIAWPTATP